VIQRRFGPLAAIGTILLVPCLALSAWFVVSVRASDASRGVSSALVEPRQAAATAGRARPLAVSAPFGACEARIERQPHRLPTVAIVGASYTAGEGPNNPELSWAVKLAGQLHWNAVIYGVPGAGYVRIGTSGRGPMARLLNAEGLRQLDPALVIVQAGHDDLGVPITLEERRVGATVDLMRAATPAARVALMTTFAAGSVEGSPALRRIDHAIITAATATDPGVIIMDPLGGRWTFPRASDGLHPTAAGDAWIARTAAAILGAHGVRPAPATSVVPVTCDVSVGVGRPATTTA
jgi:lysophospholipase L1-like esterase